MPPPPGVVDRSVVCDCGIYWSSSLVFWLNCEDVQVSKNRIRKCRLTLSKPLNNNAISQNIFLNSNENISCGFSKEPS